MKTATSKYFVLFFSGLLVYILCSLFANFNLTLRVYVGSLIYVFVFYFINRNVKISDPWLIFFIFCFPIIASLFFINILQFRAAWISLPSNVFFLLSAIAGMLFYRKKTISVCIFVLILMLFWQFSFENKFLITNYELLIMH